MYTPTKRGRGDKTQSSLFKSRPVADEMASKGPPTSELYQKLVVNGPPVVVPQAVTPLSAVLDFHRQQNKVAEEAKLKAKANATGGKGTGGKGYKKGNGGSTKGGKGKLKRSLEIDLPQPTVPPVVPDVVPPDQKKRKKPDTSNEALSTFLARRHHAPLYVTLHTTTWHSDESSGDLLSARGSWPHAADITLKLKPEDAEDGFEGVVGDDLAGLEGMLGDADWEKFTYTAQNVLTALMGVGVRRVEKMYDLKTMLWMLDPAKPQALQDALGNGTTHELNTRLKMKLQDERLAYGFTQLETPLSWLLAGMRYNGFPINVSVIRESTEQNAEKLRELEKVAVSMSGVEGFNPQSPDDLRAVLFDTMELHKKVGYQNLSYTPKKGVVSTDKEMLSLLAAHHPLPGAILEHRALQKIQSTYVQNLTQHSVKNSIINIHCVHPIFNQEGTDTGRLSCSAPNLQNQPRKGNPHGKIREAFEPLPTEVLVALDYSQIEVRVLAHVSRDPGLIKILSSGGDMHQAIAAKVFQKREEDVTGEERQAGKKVVFGMIYGQGARALAGGLGVAVERAASLLSGFKREFPVAVSWGERAVSQCRATGVVRTFANRLRRLPNIMKTNPFERSQAERQAVNTIIQGSAADIIKMAMLTTHSHSAQFGLTLLCQVHDEVIYSCPAKNIPQAIPVLKQAMENATNLCVPLKVSVEYGPSWGGMKAWEG